jgi:hypothetical protein
MSTKEDKYIIFSNIVVYWIREKQNFVYMSLQLEEYWASVSIQRKETLTEGILKQASEKSKHLWKDET